MNMLVIFMTSNRLLICFLFFQEFTMYRVSKQSNIPNLDDTHVNRFSTSKSSSFLVCTGAGVGALAGASDFGK